MFSWIVFKSRAHRDWVNAKVMKDPRLADSMDPKSMPFNVKRMVYGGFNVMVDEPSGSGARGQDPRSVRSNRRRIVLTVN